MPRCQRAGEVFSLGLKSDGSIVGWRWNNYGQCNLPEPNTDFVAVAAGWTHGAGLKSGGEMDEGAHDLTLDLRAAGRSGRLLPAGAYYAVLRFIGRAKGKRIIVLGGP